jgi:hypothetical protein
LNRLFAIQESTARGYTSRSMTQLGRDSPPAPTPWLRATRAFAAACLVLPIVLLAVFAVTDPHPLNQMMLEDSLLFLLFMAPLWFPALWILLRVGSRPRRNLALAAGLGWSVFLCAVVFAFLVSLREIEPELLILCGAYAVAHLGLAVSARQAYACLPSHVAAVRIWPAAALGVALPLAFMIAVAFPGLIATQHPPSDNAVVADLRAINTAAVVYQHDYGGYPPSLGVLGPPSEGRPPGCRSAGLIDPTLASGDKRYYTYVYTPGPPVDSPAEGCPPGVQSYTVSARPKQFGKPGRIRSFFTDESLAIHCTREDRPATPADPIVD